MAIAARASVPTALLAVAAATSVALVATAAWRPAALWPLHGVAVALLFGVGAWCSDEPLAPLVDVAPRAAPWAVRLRAAGPVALAATWAAVHLAARRSLPPHLVLLTCEGIVAVALGVAWGEHRRSLGDAGAGARAAVVVAPILIAVALLRPLADRLPLFPLWPWEPWPRAGALWTGLALVAIGLAGDAGRRRRRGR